MAIFIIHSYYVTKKSLLPIEHDVEKQVKSSPAWTKAKTLEHYPLQLVWLDKNVAFLVHYSLWRSNCSWLWGLLVLVLVLVLVLFVLNNLGGETLNLCWSIQGKKPSGVLDLAWYVAVCVQDSICWLYPSLLVSFLVFSSRGFVLISFLVYFRESLQLDFQTWKGSSSWKRKIDYITFIYWRLRRRKL